MFQDKVAVITGGAHRALENVLPRNSLMKGISECSYEEFKKQMIYHNDFGWTLNEEGI